MSILGENFSSSDYGATKAIFNELIVDQNSQTYNFHVIECSQ